MVGKLEKNPQLDIFNTPLVQFIDLNRPICILARKIDWEEVERDFFRILRLNWSAINTN